MQSWIMIRDSSSSKLFSPVNWNHDYKYDSAPVHWALTNSIGSMLQFQGHTYYCSVGWSPQMQRLCEFSDSLNPCAVRLESSETGYVFRAFTHFCTNREPAFPSSHIVHGLCIWNGVSRVAQKWILELTIPRLTRSTWKWLVKTKDIFPNECICAYAAAWVLN